MLKSTITIALGIIRKQASCWSSGRLKASISLDGIVISGDWRFTGTFRLADVGSERLSTAGHNQCSIGDIANCNPSPRLEEVCPGSSDDTMRAAISRASSCKEAI